MMWLRRAMGLQDMERQPSPISPIENNPVGWSSIYPPPPGQVMENPSPEFSPLANPAYMTGEQMMGRMWDFATKRGKPYTNADLPQLSASGRQAYDNAAGFLNPEALSRALMQVRRP